MECTSCQLELPLSEFTKKKSKSGYASHCNRCNTTRRYGKLTRVDVDNMVESQRGRCAICKEELKPGKCTVIDHEHTKDYVRGNTVDISKVRGILCSKCNKGLGSFRDNIAYLKEAVKYLEHYSK